MHWTGFEPGHIVTMHETYEVYTYGTVFGGRERAGPWESLSGLDRQEFQAEYQAWVEAHEATKGDPGEDGTKGGGYYEPATGAEEIQLVFKKEIGGHSVRIWTYGLLIRIAIGGESRIYKLPDINQLVLLIEAVKRKYGVL